MAISLLFVLLSLHQSSSTAPPTPSSTDFEFIHESCNSTLYPDICYHSLSRYASAISNSSSKLASAAISVSLSRAIRLSSYFSSLHNSSSSCSPRAAAALADCNSVFSDAVFQIRGSLAQMRRLPPIPAAEVRFQVANVQTWMSAALTYEDTCTDGFQGVPDLRLKSDVCGRVSKVAKVTSNALALVNRYAVSSTVLD